MRRIACALLLVVSGCGRVGFDPHTRDSGVDSGRVDSGRVDSGRVDSGRVDLGVDLAVVDATRIDVAVVDATRIDLAVVDAMRLDVAVVDATRIDLAVVDAMRLDAFSTPDAGLIIECSPGSLCTCPRDQTCMLLCAAGDCEFDCKTGSTCRTVCEDPVEACAGVCRSGATCVVTCNSGTCDVECDVGSTCEMSCGSGSPCDNIGCGGSCSVICAEHVCV